MAAEVATVKRDKVLTGAVEVARAAAEEIAPPGTVGEHLHVAMQGQRVAVHYFACTDRGYHGWTWAISLARAPRQKIATVCEANLLPTDAAILAPDWVPYAERLAPGDIGAGDVMPYEAQDPFLEPGFEATGDEDVDQMGFFELGLGRARVLSREGREVAAKRWYEGEHGPHSSVAAQASRTCTSCGYFMPMPGAMRQLFGVCANAWSPSDGSVVSLDHGCGAHSETDVPVKQPEQIDPPVLDELAVDFS
jgi:hypothetical protein